METANQKNQRKAKAPVMIGRVFIMLSFLALVGAWITQVTGGTLLGLSQQHLFNDAIVLSLLGIALFIDAYWHAKET